MWDPLFTPVEKEKKMSKKELGEAQVENRRDMAAWFSQSDLGWRISENLGAFQTWYWDEVERPMAKIKKAKGSVKSRKRQLRDQLAVMVKLAKAKGGFLKKKDLGDLEIIWGLMEEAIDLGVKTDPYDLVWEAVAGEKPKAPVGRQEPEATTDPTGAAPVPPNEKQEEPEVPEPESRDSGKFPKGKSPKSSM